MVPSNHLIFCCPLLLLSSIFPNLRVFYSESALHIRWPKYWSFSFSICPSNVYAGLISFRIDWFDLLAVQVTLRVFSMPLGKLGKRISPGDIGCSPIVIAVGPEFLSALSQLLGGACVHDTTYTIVFEPL